MSLRGVHIIFVIATVSLAVFFGVWAYNQYVIKETSGYLWVMAASVLAAVGFVAYGIAFAKKVKI